MGKRTQRVGKRGEYAVIGKLLENRLDVYVPIVDVENIDCVTRSPKGKFNERKIKTRSVDVKHPVFEVPEYKPRRNFFIICHFAETPDFWVIPSTKFHKSGLLLKKYNKRRITMNRKRKYELNRYHNNFGLLCD